jgi:hypothetical protein
VFGRPWLRLDRSWGSKGGSDDEARVTVESEITLELGTWKLDECSDDARSRFAIVSD